MSARLLTVAAAALIAGCATAPTPREPITVHAAGSLRAAMTDLARAFEAAQGTPVKLNFGASGLLRDRLAAGEVSQIFASANMEHPQALQKAGVAVRVEPFASNALCALAQPGFTLKGQTLAQRLLDTGLRVGISTPKADPAGDYAFRMFELIESTGAAGPGSTAALKSRALQLTGGPNSPPPPTNRNVYGAIMAAGQADVFITYCTNAAIARREVPSLQVLAVPAGINVSARYGMALMKPEVPAAAAFMRFVQSQPGQAVLATHGFTPP